MIGGVVVTLAPDSWIQVGHLWDIHIKTDRYSLLWNVLSISAEGKINYFGRTGTPSIHFYRRISSVDINESVCYWHRCSKATRRFRRWWNFLTNNLQASNVIESMTRHIMTVTLIGKISYILRLFTEVLSNNKWQSYLYIFQEISRTLCKYLPE